MPRKLVLKIIALKLDSYHLPFRVPWRTSHGTMKSRQGIILQLKTDSGLYGLGDCAPLEEMGTESQALAKQHCQQLCHLIKSKKPDLEDVIALIKKFPPATAMAVETAVMDIRSQQHQLPLCNYLNPKAKKSSKVNINLGCIDDHLNLRVENAVKKGFDTVKIKLGTQSVEDETWLLEKLFHQYNETKIKYRLDANQAWNLKQAEKFVNSLNHFGAEKIDYLEEPLSSPSLNQLETIQTQADFALAIDESLKRFSSDQIIENKIIRQVVLKPALIGGCTKTLDLYQKFQAADIHTTITSLLESAVGIAANLQLACAIDNNISHGLLSGDFFKHDLCEPPQRHQQYLNIMNQPGLGIEYKNLEFRHASL